MTTRSFEEVLATLRLEYVEGLPGRIAQARQLLAECEASPGLDKPLEELHRLLHTMTGTAGTFGFEALSQQARVIDLKLSSFKDCAQLTSLDFASIADPLNQLAGLAADV